MENKEVCHCETDLNKVADIMKKREEKAFKYDYLIKKIKDKLEELKENQRLEEEGILNREDIEAKEEIGAIKILDKLLKEEF